MRVRVFVFKIFINQSQISVINTTHDTQKASKEEISSYKLHKKSNKETQEERAHDRSLVGEETTAILSIDLENVFSLLNTNIGLLFYKSKLTVYNLTAHLSHNNNKRI